MPNPKRKINRGSTEDRAAQREAVLEVLRSTEKPLTREEVMYRLLKQHNMSLPPHKVGQRLKALYLENKISRNGGRALGSKWFLSDADKQAVAETQPSLPRIATKRDPRRPNYPMFDTENPHVASLQKVDYMIAQSEYIMDRLDELSGRVDAIEVIRVIARELGVEQQ